MSYHDWHVGMKVVCIVSDERIAALMSKIPGARYPSHGAIYTIREIRDDINYGRSESHIVLLLCEVDNSHLIGGSYREGTFCYVEPGFFVNGFRKIQPRKTDISIFTAMLHSTKTPVEA